MKKIFVNQQFETRTTDLSFLEISTTSDFWSFTENILVHSIYPRVSNKYSSESLKILEENYLIAPPRLRQLRVKPNSCRIPSIFQDKYTGCYGHFSSQNEDKSDMIRGGYKWKYQMPESNFNCWFSWGELLSYPGGGFIQNLMLSKNESVQKISELKKEKWIDSGTRVVFIEFSVFNRNTNLFCFVT